MPADMGSIAKGPYVITCSFPYVSLGVGGAKPA